jgi:hypothetical protein
MVITCNLCNRTYSRKDSFDRHLKNNSCLDRNKWTLFDIYYAIIDDKPLINNKREIIPINKINISLIEPIAMRNLIEKYDKDSGLFIMLFSKYLSNVFCNSNYPQNHCIKYIKKYPPTYNIIVEDTNGKLTSVTNGLHDGCEFLKRYITSILRKKFKECVKMLKNDRDFDYDLYEDAITTLNSDLNKDSVKKIICNFLQYDILNNNTMKFS